MSRVTVTHAPVRVEFNDMSGMRLINKTTTSYEKADYKLLDNGTLIIYADDNRVIELYAAGEWKRCQWSM